MFYKYTEDRKHLKPYLRRLPTTIITICAVIAICVALPIIPILCMFTEQTLQENAVDLYKQIRTKYSAE